MTHVAIIGGGPGGYEAALVAARLGADVTLIERDGAGGATVLTDCVPSKTLIATSDLLREVKRSDELAVEGARTLHANLNAVNSRVIRLAQAQSDDIDHRLREAGVHVLKGTGKIVGAGKIVAETAAGSQDIESDAILIATGAHPRELDSAKPDGERILNWKQVYNLTEVPEHMIVVGSGVTGAEFASAYLGFGSEVTLVSSRERVLPGQDGDAADLIERVFRERGMNVMDRSRMHSVSRDGDTVTVTLDDGRTVTGSHCLLALGSIPNTADIGLDAVGVQTNAAGFIEVDKVSRTSVPGIYAAGDCTGVFMLASVAAQQGRIAIAHLLGDAVNPLDLSKVSSNIFTAPEIATVGVTEAQIEKDGLLVDSAMLPLSGNARSKMQGVHDGFVKVYARRGVGTVLGGVVVGPRASELIHPLSLAVSAMLNVDHVAEAFTVYPSMSGTFAEVARRLHTT